MIDTHTHLDGEEFKDDLVATIQRAKEAGVENVFLPAIDLKTCYSVLDICSQYPGYAYPMLGIHPEEVKDDYMVQLQQVKSLIDRILSISESERTEDKRILAIGEVGLDYYWSREYEKEQSEAFRQQVEWSVETRLPLMIHCRKAQNEMVHLLQSYKKDLPGGVFHCFTGNEKEAEQLLQFDNFVLGIGGVLTFKKSNLPETLKNSVPMDRIVLETDSPYMAPVPMRGQRNESAYVRFVLEKLADIYQVSVEEMDRNTTMNVKKIVNLCK